MSRVRQKVGTFAEGTSSGVFYREIDAKLTQKCEITTPHVSVEYLERRGHGDALWRLRQERHAFFFFERGIQSYVGVSEVTKKRRSLQGPTRLAFVPAGTAIEAIVAIPGPCSYTAAFLETDWLTGVDEEVADIGVQQAEIGFDNPQLVFGMTQLRKELAAGQSMSRLLIESWVMQMWVHLHRKRFFFDRSVAASPLSRSDLGRVLSYMREQMADDISISKLARLTQLGPRQFHRRYRAATGMTPARTLDQIRLERAAMLLSTTDTSIMDISLDCGFSQPQHFATAFRRRFEVTPSEYRISSR